MKITSKLANKITTSISVITLIAMVLTPATALAIGHSNASNTTPKTSPFCTELSTQASNITSKLDGLISKANQVWANNNQKWSSLWQQVDQQVIAGREKADTERAQDYAKLSAKAKTTAQQLAVKIYEDAVNNAVSTRRAAYDTARTTFRNGVQAAVNNRQTTVSSQLTSFEAEVNTAIQSAEASCSANPASGSSVRATLQSALRSARLNFDSDRKSDDTVNNQVKQLASTRDASFKTADQVFQDSMNSAASTLKHAFGASGKSVS